MADVVFNEAVRAKRLQAFFVHAEIALIQVMLLASQVFGELHILDHFLSNPVSDVRGTNLMRAATGALGPDQLVYAPLTEDCVAGRAHLYFVLDEVVADLAFAFASHFELCLGLGVLGEVSVFLYHSNY